MGLCKHGRLGVAPDTRSRSLSALAMWPFPYCGGPDVDGKTAARSAQPAVGVVHMARGAPRILRILSMSSVGLDAAHGCEVLMCGFPQPQKLDHALQGGLLLLPALQLVNRCRVLLLDPTCILSQGLSGDQPFGAFQAVQPARGTEMPPSGQDQQRVHRAMRKTWHGVKGVAAPTCSRQS